MLTFLGCKSIPRGIARDTHFFACVAADIQFMGIVDEVFPTARRIRRLLVERHGVLRRLACQVFDQDIIYFEGVHPEMPGFTQFIVRNMGEDAGRWQSVESLDDEIKDGYDGPDYAHDESYYRDHLDELGHFTLRPTNRRLLF